VAKLAYPLFDTLVMGTAVQVEQALFQVQQGADATHNKSFTNMRGAGSLSNNESFICTKIGVFADFNFTVESDVENIWIGNYLELRVNDQTMIIAPLRLFAQSNGYAGHFTQTAAANDVMGGLQNDGYELVNPIAIPTGTAFRVNVPQVTVLSVASIPLRVVLHGILDRPGL
jgi:hypothetical protein